MKNTDDKRELNSQCVISLRDVIFRYKKNNPAIITLARWQVTRGEQVFIHGRSGSGKSTLLNVLTGILPYKNKGVEILGQDLSKLSSRKRDAFRAQHIGVVFQQFNLVPYLSVLENIQLAAYFANTPNEVVETRYKQLFASLSLPLDLITVRADQISVGQQQRVAIARALINNPELLIVDEPTSALDEDAKNGFMAMLSALVKANNTTLIFVSHDLSLQRFFSTQITMSELNKTELNDAA